MKKQKTKYLFSAFSLVMSIFLLVVTTFAWFIFFALSPLADFSIGNLFPLLNTDIWQNNTQWVQTNNNGNYDLVLDEIFNLAQLPNPSTIYFRLSVTEHNNIHLNCDYFLSEIGICAGKNNNGIFEKIEEVDIDFYLSPCFKFSAFFDEDDLNPTQIDFANPMEFVYQNNMLIGEGIDVQKYLYLQMDFDLDGLQGIYKNIPLKYSPYVLNFSIDFFAQVRTKE